MCIGETIMDRWDDREKAFDLNNDGVDLYEQGYFEEAIKCFDKAIWLNPDDDLLWVHKGMSLYELKNYDEAIKCFDNAIRLNAQYDDAWFYKGSTLFEQ